MFSSAEKTTKNVSVARKEAGTATFFRKAGEESFFGGKEQESFFSPTAIQAKLTVSQPDDRYEKEADQVADTVMRMPDPAPAVASKEEEKVQLKEDEQEEIQPKLFTPHITSVQLKEDDTVQTKLFNIQRKDDYEYASEGFDTGTYGADYAINRKSNSIYHSDVIQLSGRGPPATTATFENTLSSSNGGGSALPEETRSFMGNRFNANFDGVRIHTGSTAETLSSSIHAQAFTHGNNIYFNSGKYSPHTAEGGTLLAHELTHTIQQGASKANNTASTSVSRKIIQRSGEGNSQLTNAVAKAKGEEGKVNANKVGDDGFREGWPRLIEYFKTTFGEEKIISNGQAPVDGAVAEDHIKKKSNIPGPPPANPRPADGQPYIRDAMPSWCGIFVFWALNKGGVPMPKWELGGSMMKPEAAYPPGYIPKAGDIAYRDAYSHYAIVEKADGSTVTTVNGNTSGEDNLGAQVQTRDHPLDNWSAFFDPIKLKTGSLTSGEGQVEEKPKTLRELRKELFNVDRKADPDSEQEESISGEEYVQTKSELSSWSVDPSGTLNQPSAPGNSNNELLQPKEEEKQEDDKAGTFTGNILQRKSGSWLGKEPVSSSHNVNASGGAETSLSTATAHTETFNPPPHIQKQDEIAENDRGPPVQLKSQNGVIQRSWFDDAYNSVTDFAAETLAEGKRMFLREARDFVMAIPGYRALRVVLAEDPITGEEVDQNGHTFIEAAFDIMPGGRLLHQKLTELGALDDAANWIDQQLSTIHGLVQNVLDRVNNFVESISLERLASPRELFEEAGNIIHSTIQNVVNFAVNAATELLGTVKRFLITQIVDFVRNSTPAYPLLRVILGHDPVTEEVVDQNGTNILNALLELGGEEGAEQRRQMMETGSFQKVAGWIDRGIGVFSGAYDQIRAGFTNIWSRVSIESLMHPIDTFNSIYEQFAAPLRDVWNFVREAAIVIIRFIKEVLMRRLSTWARTVRGYPLVTVIIGKDPFTNEIVPRTVENLIRGFMSLMEGGEAQFDQLKESGAIGRTTARIEAAVERLNMTPAYIVQLFTDLWNSFSLNDLANPMEAFERILARFGELIGRLIAFVVEIIRIVIEVILQVMNFPSDLIANIITKAMLAIDMIKADPVGFLKNLLRAIKQGFIQFFDNILQHLMTGLTGWLLSELRDAGVTAPTDFSLRGIIGWVLEVLGVSMERIWEKLAAHPRVGPERVARIRSMINTLDGIWTFIKDVQERGIAAIWDKIQEQLTNLWDTVLGAIKTWVMDQIVNRMVTRLLSMLDPTGIMAVVNSAIALYSAVQSFVKYLREMLEIVNSFVEGVVEIASGNTRRAADYLERNLARSMPVIIGFLANQVGLSGVGRRIGEMVETVRGLVDDALTWLINRAVDTGFAIFDRLMAMGRSAVGAVSGWLGLRKRVEVRPGEVHNIYFGPDGRTLMMASTPTAFRTFLSTMVIPSHKQARLNPVKAAVDSQLLQVDTLAGNTTMDEALKTRQMQALLELIGPDVAELIRETSGTSLVSTQPQYGGLHAGFGSSMRVQIVDGRPASTGSQPASGLTNANWAKLRKRKTSQDSSDTYYIRAHLLNDNIGGPGNSWTNLSVLTQDANNRDWYGSGSHLAVETRATGPLLEEGKAFIYVVTAGYGRNQNASLLGQIAGSSLTAAKQADIRGIIEAEEFVPSSFTCTITEIDSSTGETVEDSDHNVNVSVPNTIANSSLSDYKL